MRLIHAEYPIRIDFQENRANVLSIENPTVFSAFLSDCICQTENEDGNIILSEDSGKEISFSKNVDVIVTPFTIDINNKKILNKLYSKLSSVAWEEKYQETIELNARITNYLSGLSHFSSYDIAVNDMMDLTTLFKAFNVQIPVSTMAPVEMLIEYVKAMHRVCRTELFIILNLKQYLTEKELHDFYVSVFYEKVKILVLEGSYSHKSENETGLIIDKDLCIIEV